MRFHCLLGLCFTMMSVGCSEGPTNVTKDDSSPTAAPQQQTTQKQPPAQKVKERVEAKAGVGKQGKGLAQPHVNQTIAAPVRVLVDFKQKAVFMQVKQALQLYQAQEGKLPETHDEFMEEIIKANNLRLPELPEAEKYVWDPKQGKLMVERPAN